MDANAEIVKQELELEESSVRVKNEYECKDLSKLSNEPEIYFDVEEKHSNNLPSITVKNEPNEDDDKYDELDIEIEKLKKEFSLSAEDGETKIKTEQLMLKSESNDDDTETGDADCSVRNTLRMEPVRTPHTPSKRLTAQSAFHSLAERPCSVTTDKKMSRFIDTGVVIDGVHYRCCLWDASNTNYKNKDARIRAWEEICEEMFEDVSQEEKDKLVKLIQQRWRTARDAYIKFKTSQRNCPSGSGVKKLKKYVYAQKMQFLDRKAKKHTDESTSSPLSTNSTFRSSSTQESNAPITPPPSSSPQLLITETVTQTTATSSQNCNSSRLSPKKKRNRVQLQPNSEFENQMLTLLKQNVTDISSDDMSFFQSLGPILKNFTTYQKLLFRSEVLNSAMSIQCMSNSVSGASQSKLSTNNSSQMQSGQQSGDIY